MKPPAASVLPLPPRAVGWLRLSSPGKNRPRISPPVLGELLLQPEIIDEEALECMNPETHPQFLQRPWKQPGCVRSMAIESDER
ncbi:unnamed protein product [Urochloa humidicola]